MRISDWSSDVCSSDLRVPIVITSLGARTDVNDAVHGWGGVTFHDVINRQFAAKAVEQGDDGLIAVAAGAGGPAGPPPALAPIPQIRQFFDGTLAQSGSISNVAPLSSVGASGAALASTRQTLSARSRDG